MRRVFVLAGFSGRELLRSLAIAAPLAVTLALYWLFFEYPGDVDYFAATGGFTLSMAALVTTLLLANQFNRSSGYVILGRLRRRSELLAAIVVCTAAVAGLMGILYMALALGMRKVEIAPAQMVLIAPRWLVLSLFTTTVTLHLTRLASRGLSYLAALGILAFVATIQEQRGFLLRTELAGLVRVITRITGPIAATLTGSVADLSPAHCLASLALTLAYAVGLFMLAVSSFRRKDLLWVE